MNLKSLLNKSINGLSKASSPTPELDARVLLEESIKRDHSFVYSHPEYLITNAQYSRFRRFIRRRKKGEPVAYILGHKEFYGLDFKVNKNVLIPRPESEFLVEKGIEFLSRDETKQNCHSRPVSEYGVNSSGNPELYPRVKPEDDDINILDMGTGSGCIIVSIVKNLPTKNYQLKTINYHATDISPKALRIARQNAKIHQVDNVHFYLSDLFANKKLPRKFDLIVANLPYVPSPARIQNTEYPTTLKLRGAGRIQQHRRHSEVAAATEESSEAIQNNIRFEPQNSIYAADNGMAIIKKFLIEVKDRINEGGMILLEADCRNAKKIFRFAKKHYPDGKIALKKDLASLDRYIIINV